MCFCTILSGTLTKKNNNKEFFVSFAISPLLRWIGFWFMFEIGQKQKQNTAYTVCNNVGFCLLFQTVKNVKQNNKIKYEPFRKLPPSLNVTNPIFFSGRLFSFSFSSFFPFLLR
eukprot:TRINITY_DN7345_c0_g1_i2.p1 TRINITY_DN7345_c0_g1~~TRINITY_DN7345_c0_g1_i2.p1  ORF type:complete len:114 (+),score=15.30 TRINITY_DN7345_c0_g1_i2:281-622(+)